MNHRYLTTPLSNPLDAEREIIAALDCADDERLWHTLRQHPDEDRLLRVVAEEAPRMAHRLRTAPFFSELLLVPVIERNRGAVVGNAESWKGAERCVSDALQLWQGQSRRNTVFRGVLPYEWIAAWEPSMLRHHLLAAAPGASHRSLTFQPAPLHLPDEAPRLGFIVVAVTDGRGWPELPPPDTLRDVRFRDVVGHALATGPNGQAAEVLHPDQVSAGLADGLCLWLAMLTKQCRSRDGTCCRARRNMTP